MRPAVPPEVAGQDTACKVVERAFTTLRRLETQDKRQSFRNRGSLGRRENVLSGAWNPLSFAVTLAAPEQSGAAVSWCDLSCGAQPRDSGLRVVAAARIRITGRAASRIARAAPGR